MELNNVELQRMRERFFSSPKNMLAMNAASNNSPMSVALNRRYVSNYNHAFSHEIPSMKITNQQRSGRCWIFAGLNVLRYKIAKELGLKEFELSQSYVMFYDKLEKSNYFLQAIIETVGEDLHSRTVSWLLERLVGDGGQWGMLSNLLKKYGVVPKEVMKESYSSSNSRVMNMILQTKLRENAMVLRQMHEEGKSVKELETKKMEMLDDIYRILSINLGVPPEKFTYQYKDKDENYHILKDVTPTEFLEKYAKLDLDSMVSVINCPTSDKEYMKTYTVKYLGNVVGGDNVVYLNVSMQDMKKMAVEAISNGEPTWFAADSGKMMEREKGIFDVELFDFENLYDVKFTFNKAQRLDYAESLMTHAMVLQGVDIVDGEPVKWKVENSWGDKNGKDGYFIMGDKWFDEFVYEIVVDKSYLSDEMKKALEEKPVMLPPWDPMGSVARVLSF